MFSAEIWELVQCKQLVYSAPGLSGGVGLTAVQYALRLGAVVYATAGNQVSSIFRFDPQSVTEGPRSLTGQAELSSADGCEVCSLPLIAWVRLSETF